jgi:hypothetical protein
MKPQLAPWIRFIADPTYRFLSIKHRNECAGLLAEPPGRAEVPHLRHLCGGPGQVPPDCRRGQAQRSVGRYR